MARPRLMSFPSRWIVFCDVLAMLFWLYVIIKSFLFDIDAQLIHWVDPSLDWIRHWKFLFVAIIFSFIGVCFGKNKLLMVIGYIILFPVIILLHKIPFLLFDIGSWTIGIAVFNNFISMVANFRYRLISFSAYATSFLLIHISNDETVLWIGISLLSLTITVTFVKTFINAFNPPHLLSLYQQFSKRINQAITDSSRLEEDDRGLPIRNMAPEKIKTVAGKLQVPVLYNRACLFFAERLQEYQRSEFGVVSGILSSLSLIGIKLFSFSFLYLGAYKINPQNFSSYFSPTPFDLFHVSFNSMIFGGGSEDVLVGQLATGLSMFERFLSVMIVLVFISILISVKNKRHQIQLAQTVSELEASGREIESFIRDDYSYNDIDEAIDDLIKAEAAFSRFIVRMSNSLKSRDRRSPPSGQ